MQLQSLLTHKKNTSVSVNGNIYKIAMDLVVRDEQGNPVDVPQTDAEKLLNNSKAWKVVGNDTGKTNRVEAKAKLKVVMADGSVVAPKTQPEIVSQLATPIPEAKAAPIATEAPKPATGSIQDPPIPKKGEEWADPSVNYSLEWLQACASAYQVTKSKTKDKAALVKKIKAAMYD